MSALFGRAGALITVTRARAQLRQRCSAKESIAVAMCQRTLNADFRSIDRIAAAHVKVLVAHKVIRAPRFCATAGSASLNRRYLQARPTYLTPGGAAMTGENSILRSQIFTYVIPMPGRHGLVASGFVRRRIEWPFKRPDSKIAALRNTSDEPSAPAQSRQPFSG